MGDSDLSVQGATSLNNLTARNVLVGGSVNILEDLAASGLDVSGATTLGSVSANGAADCSASSVTVPEPSADSEAATKLYVDAAIDTVSAPGLVKVALTSNVALTAAAKEQQSVTLAAGDLVLLTGQTVLLKTECIQSVAYQSLSPR